MYMKKIFTIILVIMATTCLLAQRFQVGDLYYQVCFGEEDIIADLYDTIGWNIPAEAITVAQAHEICATLESGETTGIKYYVMGYVKKLHSRHTDGVTIYGNAQFYMEDVKGADSSTDLMAFQVYGPNGKKITDPAAVAVGDFVVIYGELTNYNGTYETVGKGSAYIWKSTNPLLNGYGGGSNEAGETPNPNDVTGAGTYDNPYTASDVVAMANTVTGNYFVKAYIVGQVGGVTLSGSAEFVAPFSPSTNSDGTPNTYSTNILVASADSITDITKCVPVQLPSGALRSGLNLPENPEMHGKEILIYGSLEKYFGVAGIKSSSYAVIDGKELGINPNASSGNENPNSGDNNGTTEPVPEGIIVFDADVDQGDAGTDSNNPTVYTITKNGMTIKVSSGILGTYNNEKHYRIYKNQTLTITSTAGNIKEIVFTCTANNDAKYGPGCFAWSTGDYTYSGPTGTWTGSASEVVFTASYNQVRATQIEVVVDNDGNTTKKRSASSYEQSENHYVYVTYQTIGEANYNSLGSVEIPQTVEYEGITYNVIGIGYAAFKHSTLESITIPSSIKIIGEHIFDNCSALTNVVWNVKNHADFDYKPVGSTYEYTSPFYNIRSQITSFIFGNEVEYIPAYLCCDMNNLNKITIPTNVKDIGDYALSGTGHYNDDSNWENDVLYIDNCLIRAKKTLSGDYTIKEGTRLIAASALFLRQELTSVTIPNSVTNIGAHAFEGCSGLTSIISEAITPPTVGSYAFNSVNYQIPIYVPCGCISAYKAATGWSNLASIQESPAIYSIAVDSKNGEIGLAEVEKNTLCGATIYATPNLGYHFVKWSDGNTDNPRILELTQDTVLTAEFAQSFSGQCGDSLYWSYDESDQSISSTGSGNMYNYTSETQPWLLFKEQIKIVTTSNTTTSIGKSAFAGAIRLGEVNLGANIENIAANAFAECNRLYHIYCYPTYPPFAEQTSFANYNVYLHVPCENKEGYDLDFVWGNFKYIKCIGAETNNTPTDTVIINASSSSVTIIWPTESNANTYTIVIKKGNEVFCTLKFNAEGQLLNIAFAPSRDGNNHPTQYAEQAGNGYRFTVTGLEEGTHYAYNIDVKDTANKIIKSHTGEFTTESMTAVENTYSTLSEANTQKLLRNGHLYILQDGKIYNAMGQEM